MRPHLINDAIKTHAPIIPENEYERYCFEILINKLKKLFDGTYSYERAVFFDGNSKCYCLLVRKTKKNFPEVQFAIMFGGPDYDVENDICWEMSSCSRIEGRNELFFESSFKIYNDPNMIHELMELRNH